MSEPEYSLDIVRRAVENRDAEIVRLTNEIERLKQEIEMLNTALRVLDESAELAQLKVQLDVVWAALTPEKRHELNLAAMAEIAEAKTNERT